MVEKSETKDQVAPPDGPESVPLDGGPSSQGTPQVESFPEDSSILWTPRQAPVRANISVPYQFVLSQRVLRDIHTHVAEGAGREVTGLLAGQVFECPESERLWVRAEKVFSCEKALSEDTSLQKLKSAFRPLREQIGSEGRQVVGWYHSHSLLGVFLSERDARVHRELFDEPWQCAVVLVTDPDRPNGGLFQKGVRGGLRRSVYVPFFELLDGDAAGRDGGLTQVSWPNYKTDDRRVQSFSIPDGSTAGDRGAGEPKGEPGTDVEVGEDVEGGGLPAVRSTEVSLEDEFEIPLVLPGADQQWLAVRRRRRLGMTLRVGALAVLGVTIWFAWGQFSSRGSAVERRGAAPTSVPTSPTTVRAPTFEQRLGEFHDRADGYQERRADFDLGRIDCAGLSVGYVRVDEAFLSLSERFAAVSSTPGRENSYGNAGVSIDNIDRHFDASGCPRPQ